MLFGAKKAPKSRTKLERRAFCNDPSEIRVTGYVVGAQPVDIAQSEIVGAPVGDVAGALSRVDIVGEQTAPARPEPGAGHAAAGEEFKKGGRRHCAELARVGPPRFPNSPQKFS